MKRERAKCEAWENASTAYSWRRSHVRDRHGGNLFGDRRLLNPTKNILFIVRLGLGDGRVNQHPDMAVSQVALLRLHNFLVTEFAPLNPQWNDEILYQEARKFVIAVIQHITYNEFLPILLGKIDRPTDAASSVTDRLGTQGRSLKCHSCPVFFFFFCITCVLKFLIRSYRCKKSVFSNTLYTVKSVSNTLWTDKRGYVLVRLCTKTKST